MRESYGASGSAESRGFRGLNAAGVTLLRNRRAASTFPRPMPNASAPKDFQGLLLALQTYWADRGCALMQGYDLEVGAGTMNPATFLRVLGPQPRNVGDLEPSRRPAGGPLCEDPNP